MRVVGKSEAMIHMTLYQRLHAYGMGLVLMLLATQICVDIIRIVARMI